MRKRYCCRVKFEENGGKCYGNLIIKSKTPVAQIGDRDLLAEDVEITIDEDIISIEEIKAIIE